MIKVIEQYVIEGYAILKINKTKPESNFTKYIIKNQVYEAVYTHNFPDDMIAVQSVKNFVGEEIKFI